MNATQFYLGILISFATPLLLISCDKSDQNNNNITSITDVRKQEIERIIIKPGAALLTGINDSMQLKATAFSKAGTELPSSFVWSTSKPEVVKVDQNGIITAISLGSAQVEARASNFESDPVIVAVAIPAEGVVIIDDDDILSEPSVHNSETQFGEGTEYDVTVRGIDMPMPGTLIASRGEKPLAGEVVAATRSGSNILLKIKVVQTSRMLPNLSIDETVELKMGENDVTDEVKEHFNVTTNPDGSITLTPK